MRIRSFLLLAIGVLGGASLASAGPVSSCLNNVGNSGFTCNFFETTLAGTPSEISNVVSFPSLQSVTPGYVVLLESPSALQTDPTQWSDVLQFIADITGQATSAQLFSIGCNCFPTFATVNAASHAFLVETQTGQGNDFTDSTQFVAGFNTFNIFSAAPNAAPEPASLVLMGSALIFLVGGLAFTRSRRA